MRSYFNMLDNIQGLLYGHIIGSTIGNYYSGNVMNKELDDDIVININDNDDMITENCKNILMLVDSLILHKEYIQSDILSHMGCKGILHADNDKYNYDNSFLKRISPVATLSYKISKYKLLQIIEDNCLITNNNDISFDAAKVYILSIQDALQNKSKRQIIKNAYNNSNTSIVKNIIESSKKTPYPEIDKDIIKNSDKQHRNYFGISLQNMYYEFIHNDSFHKSIIHIINRGGDIDSNTCIAGAFLGAFYGIEYIPKDWKLTIFNKIKKYRIDHNFDYNNINQLAYFLYTLNIK